MTELIINVALVSGAEFVLDGGETNGGSLSAMVGPSGLLAQTA